MLLKVLILRFRELILMGFLKFLKKKNADDELLDMPPVPPIGAEEGFDIPQGLNDILPPAIEGLESQQIANNSQNDYRLDIPFPEQEPEQETAEQDYAPKTISTSRIGGIQQMPAKAVTFLKIEQYRIILEDISGMRENIKVAEENAHAAHIVSEEEEKARAKIKSNLQEIQKKLLLIDKVLAQ